MTIARSENEPHPRLTRPPQFGLRTLLLFITILSALFAIVSSLGTTGTVIVIWGLLLVGAHVSAIVFGTKARSRPLAADVFDEGPAVWSRPRSQGRPSSSGQALRPATQHRGTRQHEARQPASQLGRKSLSTTYASAAACIGAALGGLIGVVTLSKVYWGHASILAISFGALSAAVLGGFVGFLLSSWWDVMSTAWAEAVDDYDAAKAKSTRHC